MELEILIPTYNRANDLIKNLNLIVSQIEIEGQGHQINIVVSDNNSIDTTSESILAFKDENPGLSLTYHRNSENIGLENNMLKLLELASKEFILFLGDDDYLPAGYLNYVLRVLEDGEIGCIIPGNATLYSDGKIEPVRTQEFQEEKFAPGFSTALSLSHYGNQLSGLVLKDPKDLLASYLDQSYTSIYLFIFFVTRSLLNYSSVFVPHYNVLITSFNRKDWSYDEAGLLPEIYRAYYMFREELGDKKVVDLIIRFTIMHSWRLGIVVFNPIKSINRLRYLLNKVENLKGLRRRLIFLFLKEYGFRMKQKIIN